MTWHVGWPVGGNRLEAESPWTLARTGVQRCAICFKSCKGFVCAQHRPLTDPFYIERNLVFTFIKNDFGSKLSDAEFLKEFAKLPPMR